MSLNVLSLSFAPVTEDPVGGAEQVLSRIDRAIVAAGHRSIVIARPEFGSCHLRDGTRIFGRFHPDAGHPGTETRLSPTELARKQAALACFRTRALLLALFDPAAERLRRAPDYDFRAPAPPGSAFYDGFGCTMTSARWRAPP